MKNRKELIEFLKRVVGHRPNWNKDYDIASKYLTYFEQEVKEEETWCTDPSCESCKKNQVGFYKSDYCTCEHPYNRQSPSKCWDCGKQREFTPTPTKKIEGLNNPFYMENRK